MSDSTNRTAQRLPRTEHAILGWLFMSATAIAATPKMPGVGARTTGGDGHAVIPVTSLEDSGPSTLREALAEGDRRIVFRAGGTIQLRSPLVIQKPNYFEDDDRTIAGEETLQARPDLIRKRPVKSEGTVEDPVRIYTSTANNSVADWYKAIPEARHVMSYTLRPGGSLMRSSGNWGKYLSSLYPDEPEVYGNGRFSYAPRFTTGKRPDGAEAAENVEVKEMPGGAALMPASADRTGELVYRFAGPYPYLGGAVQLTGVIAAGGRARLDFSETGTNWQPVWEGREAGPLHAMIATSGYFRNGYGSPAYTYHLRLSLTGGVRVSWLRVSSDIQVAPASLPAFAAGENAVRYQDATTGPRDVEVVFTYDPE